MNTPAAERWGPDPGQSRCATIGGTAEGVSSRRAGGGAEGPRPAARSAGTGAWATARTWGYRSGGVPNPVLVLFTPTSEGYFPL